MDAGLKNGHHLQYTVSKHVFSQSHVQPVTQITVLRYWTAYAVGSYIFALPNTQWGMTKH